MKLFMNSQLELLKHVGEGETMVTKPTKILQGFRIKQEFMERQKDKRDK